MRTGRRITAAVCLFGIIACVLTGCVLETPDDECIVKEKEIHDSLQVASAEDGLTIESQVQAEETCEMEAGDGMAQVSVHADVVVPSGEGMKIRSAKPRFFDQEDLDSWIRVLTQGKELWNFADSEYDQSMSWNDVWAWVGQLENQLVKLETDLVALSGDEAERTEQRISDIQQWIGYCRDYLETGIIPYETAKSPVEWKLQNIGERNMQETEEAFGWGTDAEGISMYDGASDGTDALPEESLNQELYGYVNMQDIFAPWATDEEKTYTCHIINLTEGGSGTSGFEFFRRYRGSYVALAEDEVWENAQSKITKKRMRKAADDLVEALGLSDELKYKSSEAVYSSEIEYSPYGNHFLEDSRGWRFYYVRELDGIKMAHAADSTSRADMLENLVFALETYFGWDAAGTMKELDSQYQDSPAGGREEMFSVTFDDEGLVGVSWLNPYTVGENASDNVFLLPFSEILQIFEKSVTKQYVLEMISGMNIPVKADITEIRLGYMLVEGEGKPESVQIVPVWDFVGTYECEGVEEALEGEGNIWVQSYLKQKKSESFLTINATDGTILN